MSELQTVVVLDFGSQYCQLIARRVRECRVYSRIVRFDIPAAELARERPAGIILSGGPASVYQEGAPQCDPGIFALGIPVLGICYGMQMTVQALGGRVERGQAREYGKAELAVHTDSDLLAGLDRQVDVWMSHGDKVTALPPGFATVARTANTEFAAVEDPSRRLYGIQFHPEVVHTPRGQEVLANFCRRVCACRGDWTMAHFITEATAEIRRQVGDGHVVLGLSGGVDSSVAAALIHQAIGDRLTCIFVNSLLRRNEAERVRAVFADNFRIDLRVCDVEDRFLTALAGISEPEAKRKAIGRTFVEIFQETAAGIPGVSFLAQGTTYPDVIESVPIGGNPSAMIKSHHNVGGLPEKMHLALVEPLARLFKDEVREVGRQLGLPKEIIWRHPFPGPGLAVRIIGEVTAAGLTVLREADAIVIQEMKRAELYYRVWQAFAVLLPVKTVGVMGDERTYENVVALRVVESQDGMTADWVRVPYEVLGTIANRIINEVTGVNRVVFDLTSKPPGTIEWE